MEAIPKLKAERAEEARDRTAADPDEQLALRARTDREAQAELYVRHHGALFRYLRARCRNDDVALELTAVSFEKALRAIGRYRSQGGGVRAWLLRIARNAATDHERRRRPLIPQWPMNSDHRSPDPGPEEMAIARDERRRVRLLLADLSELQRDAIALRYGAGLSAREIGAVIGKSEEATQKLISRAVARLKEAHDAQH
ncbi:MAG: RNA polymerase sigma factor [Patescibacteria group bacterium]